MATGFYTHPDCLLHDTGDGHPERAARLQAIEDQLIGSRIDIALQRETAPLASETALLRAHSAAHVAAMRACVPATGQAEIDADTFVGPHSWNAALRAAGAALAATDAVIDGHLDNAFCCVRPPGHHALREQAMGFCLFNNVAVAALHALEARHLARVAVIDFDVHHGNGTEAILAGDPRVLMCGFFQHPFYPFSGVPPLAPNMLNVPLAARSDGAAMREAVTREWLPRLRAFAPQMIFISAGFDAHRDDDLGNLGLVEADFAWLTRCIREVAAHSAQGRIVSCLEGGYALSALGRSVVAHVRELADL
ncbi:histone deacetylase family protein [Robbsia sp. Bb-Pol-6]|uniref:Histone deacetylase family protein n=1 Tax=Robbsia betulipollinis TaxID=2981849 RepID=A0ABT3ZQ00_9BURK|nr:histone deacetylase family protein [Robbsia betulipollinis]MCY0388633.1 histone deacetylase family protein [Robbsia betulipollinis]